ncbi:hypothetical protein MZM54_02935 [[Brevibacterium] frigoritolerans]|nr:hypothetical protein [Peribacillus frigoritolerans]
MGILRFAKSIESKIRFLLISFCAYSFLYSIIDLGISRYIEQINVNDIKTIGFLAFISIMIGIFIKNTMKEIFDDTWDWTVDTVIEKIQNEFICLMGVGTLYYFSQVGMMVLFFPSFEMFVLYGVKLYHIVFVVNAVIMYCVYRMTILKF